MTANTRPKVLLSSAYGPYALGAGESMHDMFASRLSRGQGVFSMSSHCHYFGLHLIAENIDCPATVLEDPHLDEFEAELAEGYDYVAFQLKSIHTERVARMIRLTRVRSPRSKIVVGGYGVGTLEDGVPGDAGGSAGYILENAHHFCREDGVRFIRRLLGDGAQDRPITQDHLPFAGFSLRGFSRRYFRVPTILVSLGCPYGCDFCNTSASFRRKKTRIAEPGEVHALMKRHARRLRTGTFMTLLFDEDLFQDPEYVRELGRLIRADRSGWGFKWFSFGSVRSLSRFDPEELRDCGCFAVWIGVESALCADRERAGDQFLGKRVGDIERIFRGLHANGIATVASMAVGFDFHDRETVERDLDFLLRLEPTFYQVAPLVPCPGTELYRRLKGEGRLHDGYRWEDFHLWGKAMFRPKSLAREEVSEFVALAHERLTQELGPPFLRLMENYLSAYERLAGSEDDFHRRLRGFFKAIAKYDRCTLRPIMKLGASKAVRERAAELERRCLEILGEGSLWDRFLAATADWCLSRAARKAGPNGKPASPACDPPARWTYYHSRPGSDAVYVRKGHGPGRAKKRPSKFLGPLG
ncbi:MAG: radical SAM protein [Elusimicrobiota bacterium]